METFVIHSDLKNRYKNGYVGFLNSAIYPKENDKFVIYIGINKEITKGVFIEPTPENILNLADFNIRIKKKGSSKPLLFCIKSDEKDSCNFFTKNKLYQSAMDYDEILDEKDYIEEKYLELFCNQSDLVETNDEDDLEKYDISFSTETQYSFLLLASEDFIEYQKNKSESNSEYRIHSSLSEYPILKNMTGLKIVNKNGYGTEYTIVEVNPSGVNNDSFIFKILSDKGSTYYIDTKYDITKYRIVKLKQTEDKAKENERVSIFDLKKGYVIKNISSGLEYEATQNCNPYINSVVVLDHKNKNLIKIDTNTLKNDYIYVSKEKKEEQVKKKYHISDEDLENKKKLKNENKPKEKENNFMSILKNNVCQQGQDNIEAAKIAANIQVGQLINKRLCKIAASKLPMGMGGVAKSPIFSIAIANAMGMAIKQFMPDNKKAAYIAQASLNASAVEALNHLNLEEMLDGLLDGIKLPENAFEGEPDEDEQKLLNEINKEK